MLDSTSKFEVVQIVYDDGEFAIAEGYWDGNRAELNFAARWHEGGGIGYPQTYGKPQWFLFPNNIGSFLGSALRLIPGLKP